MMRPTIERRESGLLVARNADLQTGLSLLRRRKWHAATDVTIAATVTQGVGCITDDGFSGEAITQGMWIYLDVTTGTYKKARCTTQAAAQVKGVALNTVSAAGQAIRFAKSGQLDNCGTLVVGEVYVLSETTFGAMMKVSDLGAGEFSTICGQGGPGGVATSFRIVIGVLDTAHA